MKYCCECQVDELHKRIEIMEGRYLKDRNEKFAQTLDEIKVCANKCLGFYRLRNIDVVHDWEYILDIIERVENEK